MTMDNMGNKEKQSLSYWAGKGLQKVIILSVFGGMYVWRMNFLFSANRKPKSWNFAFCCGLTQQAAKHHIAVCSLPPPPQGDGRENQE